MTLDQEVSRGVQARQILEDQLFQESVKVVQDDIFEKFSSADPSNLEELRIQRLRLKCLADITRQIQTVMETGYLAEQEIERQKTLTERSIERVRKGIRAVF